MRLIFEEFEAVAPGIFCVETADLWERGVVCDFDAASEQGVTQFVEVSGNEGGMGFLGGAEIVLDADVELLGAAFEPAAASCAERLRFFNFSHAEKSARNRGRRARTLREQRSGCDRVARFETSYLVENTTARLI